MKTATILHGMPTREEYKDPNRPASSNCHRVPWLQRQLTLNDICTQTPEMPIPYNPEYTAWKKVFEGCPLDEHTILVGHSCGGWFILRYLSEHDIKVGKVILVAPWIDTTHELDTGMFDFILDNNIIHKTKNIVLFESTDDEYEVQESIQIIKQHLPSITVKTFEDYGHFCIEDLKTEAFPELLETCLK